jgi:hypothetical protein
MIRPRVTRNVRAVFALCVLGLVAAPVTAAHSGYHPGEPEMWVKQISGPNSLPDGEGGGGCWASQSWHGDEISWLGVYYYEFQRVHWCGDGTRVTSVSYVNSWTEVRGYCWTHQPARIWWNGGGIGHGSVDYRSQAEFKCEGPNVSLAETVWHVPRYYGNGLVAMAGHH